MRLNAHLLYALFKHTFKTGMKNKGIGKIYLLAKRIAVGEMPSHTHNIFCGFGEDSTGSDALRYQTWAKNNQGDHSFLVRNAGGSLFHNNLQPSNAVYRFKRIS